MTRNEQFLAEVREWIGTPFQQQQAAKGYGCDCKGLIWGAARELGWPEAEAFHATFIDYDLRRPFAMHQLLVEGMAAIFDPVTEGIPGDVLLCNLRGRPGHMAVLASESTAIHTQLGPRAFVKETALRVLYHGYPLHSIWRWRDDV